MFTYLGKLVDTVIWQMAITIFNSNSLIRQRLALATKAAPMPEISALKSTTPPSSALVQLREHRISFLPPRALALMLCFVAQAALAQTTAFTYQGKLTDGNLPATGTYDFQFKCFDALSGSGQQGSTMTVAAVQVTNGIFTVELDFGAGAFSGADRFLEIAVKPTGNPSFTSLSPRQPVTPTPYSIHSLTATVADGLSVACINCVTSSQIQNVQGSQVTGTIPVASVPAGSTNYIQNATSQQAASNFNVSGSGTVGATLTGNIVSAATQYNIGASRILSNAGTSNTFIGIGSGQVNSGLGNTFAGANSGLSNTSGGGNAFFGNAAGLSNTTGLNNSFFGAQAGQSDTAGGSNSFFGYQAGFSTTTAGNNSFFGTFAGLFNSTGANNTFVGMNAGRANNTGSSNAFFGSGSGQANTIGANNAFFGFNAGLANTSGGNNSFFGQNAGAANTTGIHNSFFGDSAGAANTASFNSFFGDNAGLSNTTGTANAFFGRAAGLSNTTASDNSLFGFNAGLSNTGGQNSFFGRSAGVANTSGASNAFFGYNAGVVNTTGGNNSFHGYNAGGGNTTGAHNSFFGDNAGSTNTTGSNNTFIGAGAGPGFFNNLDHATAIGAGASVDTSNTIQLGRDGITKDFVRVPGSMVILGNSDVLGFFSVSTLFVGSTPLCIGNNNELATCVSSLRYKTNVTPYLGGLSIINRLNPISFTWKADRMRDVGLAAEQVARVEPLLTFTNAKGEIEGVKYNQLSVVLINTIKEQQAQITRQRAALEALKRLVCLSHPTAKMCAARRNAR